MNAVFRHMLFCLQCIYLIFNFANIYTATIIDNVDINLQESTACFHLFRFYALFNDML
mgnify:CR=1 FL=1